MLQATSDQISQYFVSTWRNMEAMATAIQDLFELTKWVFPPPVLVLGAGPARVGISLVLAGKRPEPARPREAADWLTGPPCLPCLPCVLPAGGIRWMDGWMAAAGWGGWVAWRAASMGSSRASR